LLHVITDYDITVDGETYHFSQAAVYL
jgi:hypothetical protein